MYGFIASLSGCQNTALSAQPNSSFIEHSHTDTLLKKQEQFNKPVLEQLPPDSPNITNNSAEHVNSIEPSTALPNEDAPISPRDYQKLLGAGMNVDWSKTYLGQEFYNSKTVSDFKSVGIHHVRIRIKNEANSDLFFTLDKQVDDCIANGLIPVIAYQADELKNEPTPKNIQAVVAWWSTVAEHYQSRSPLLAFDMLIEVTDTLSKQPEKLNEIYNQIVTEIRKTNPTRIIMMSPRLRSDVAYLNELTLPVDHNGYMMAEWHFYASGPSKDNDRKLWTVGTHQEKQLILHKIEQALTWERDTGIPTWVGAWMPGNYNDGSDYTIEEQVLFAEFMTKSLQAAGIPFAVNADTKFYNRATNCWITDMRPVLNTIFQLQA